jgi:hypothetical protein
MDPKFKAGDKVEFTDEAKKQEWCHSRDRKDLEVVEVEFYCLSEWSCKLNDGSRYTEKVLQPHAVEFRETIQHDGRIKIDRRFWDLPDLRQLQCELPARIAELERSERPKEEPKRERLVYISDAGFLRIGELSFQVESATEMISDLQLCIKELEERKPKTAEEWAEEFLGSPTIFPATRRALTTHIQKIMDSLQKK